MQFATQASLPLACFFFVHVSEIQGAVQTDIEESFALIPPEFIDFCRDRALNELQSCCQWSKSDLPRCAFEAVISMWYAVLTFALSLTVFRSQFESFWLFWPSFNACVLLLLMAWALSLLRQSTDCHAKTMKDVLGGVAFAHQLDILQTQQRTTFMRLYKLLNDREKEATFIVDLVITDAVTILFLSLCSWAIFLTFKFISLNISHKPIFFLGSELLAVNMQVVLNVVIFSSLLVLVLYECFKYSLVTSKDAKLIQHKVFDILQDEVVNGVLQDGITVENHMATKAYLLGQLKDYINDLAKSITFLGTPITLARCRRFAVYHVSIVLLFFSWFLSVWDTLS